MKRAFYLPLAAIVFAGCQDQQLLSPPTDGPLFAISDGANSGNPDFWFLPPVVNNPQGNLQFDRDEFNPNLRPVVEICQSNSGCGNEFAAVLGLDHYQFDWKTQSSDAGKRFRLRVLAGTNGFELGFFDADVTSEGKSAEPGNLAVKAGTTVPINFSIENGALCDPPGTSPCTSQTVDLAEDNTIELRDEAGEVIAHAVIPSQGSESREVTFTMQLCTNGDLNDPESREENAIDVPVAGDCVTITPVPAITRENPLENAATVAGCRFLRDLGSELSQQQGRYTLFQASEDGTVRALPDVPDQCQTVGSREGNLLFQLAQKTRDRFASWFGATPLYANNVVVIDRGGGGKAGDFESDFQYALSAKMEYFVPEGGDHGTHEPVTPLLTQVKVTDVGNQPVEGARVTFTIREGDGSVGSLTTTDMTDGSGIAEVTWTIGGGDNLLEASGRGIADPSCEGCVDGVFAPDHDAGEEAAEVIVGTGVLAITATGAAGFGYGSGDWKFLIASGGGGPEGFEDPEFNDSDFDSGRAPFWNNDGGAGCEITPETGSGTDWPVAGTGVVTNPDLFTHIFLRKTFFLPSNATGVIIGIAIDNDYQVFLNGADITGFALSNDGNHTSQSDEGPHFADGLEDGLQRHGGCAIEDDFVYFIDDDDDGGELLNFGGMNLLAIHARDRGVMSYVDVRVSEAVEP